MRLSHLYVVSFTAAVVPLTLAYMFVPSVRSCLHGVRSPLDYAALGLFALALGAVLYGVGRHRVKAWARAWAAPVTGGLALVCGAGELGLWRALPWHRPWEGLSSLPYEPLAGAASWLGGVAAPVAGVMAVPFMVAALFVFKFRSRVGSAARGWLRARPAVPYLLLAVFFLAAAASVHAALGALDDGGVVRYFGAAGAGTLYPSRLRILLFLGALFEVVSGVSLVFAAACVAPLTLWAGVGKNVVEGKRSWA